MNEVDAKSFFFQKKDKVYLANKTDLRLEVINVKLIYNAVFVQTNLLFLVDKVYLRIYQEDFIYSSPSFCYPYIWQNINV